MNKRRCELSSTQLKHVRELDRENYHKNRDKELRRNKKRYCQNRKRLLKYANTYYHENRITILQKRRPKQWAYWLKTMYGMTIHQYADTLKVQNSVCAICQKKQFGCRSKKLFVDHNHKTGKIRGLLCKDCNLVLGHCKESIPLLQSVITYLRRFQNNGTK